MRPQKCSALGIHVINGPMDPEGKPCKWATSACAKNCYVVSYLRRWRNAPSGAAMQSILVREAAQWRLWSACHVQGIRFVRLCSRGEGLRDRDDVEQVYHLVASSPETQYILPTRAHNDPEMRTLIEERLFGLQNLHLLASVDKSTTREHFEPLVASGWSTMGFFSTLDIPHPLAGDNVERCAKTWSGAHGETACRACGEQGKGCFKPGQKNIYLRQHS